MSESASLLQPKFQQQSTRWKSLSALAVAIVGLWAGSARGQNSLITINTTTGLGTLVAPLGATVSPTGLAFRGAQLYIWDNVADRVRELNPATGATIATLDVGATIGQEGDIAFRSDGVGFLSGGGGRFYDFDATLLTSNFITGGQNPPMDGLAFNSTDVMYGLREDGSSLHTINPVTAATTLVGPTGIPAGYNLGGLAFDSSDNLFASVSTPGGPSFLYQLNTTTGVATLVGNIGFTGVSGIRFDASGTLFGITYGAAAPVPGVTITESAGSTNVTEGGTTDTYTIVLNAAPTGNVTITINPGTQLTVSPATLTFTPATFNTAQTVTVTAIDDVVIEGVRTGTITHTSASTDAAYNNIVIANVIANITDNDFRPTGGEGSQTGSNGPAVSPSPFGFTEGGFGLGIGRSQPSRKLPILNTPVFDPVTRAYVVRNVAHRSHAQVAAKPSTAGGASPWLLLLVPGLLLIAAAVAKGRF